MTIFKGNLGNYKIIKTEDNSETIWSEFFDEACHNLSGAYEETIYNYINGCNIPELLSRNLPSAILDVGFGVGLGLKALIDQIKISSNKNIQCSYYSIELDEALILWSLKNTIPELLVERIECQFEDENLIYYQGNWNNILNIKIYLGDGRLTLPKAFRLNQIELIDAIFQDAFSPRKNPILWSVEWFIFLKKISKKTVKLSTYSSSVSIRKSLHAAEWIISDAVGFSRKKAMTHAKLTGETSSELLIKMAQSPTIEIRDK